MSINKISIIVPAYNEASTISNIIDKLINLSLINNINKEIIIVNDCSTDNTAAIVENTISMHPSSEIYFISHEKNSGKGAAIHTGIKNATGDYLIIQDADTISEISTFIEKKGSYQADDGYNDDLVMTLVLFSWFTSTSYFKDLNNVNLREIMYKKQMQAIEEELTPFGFYDDGGPEKPPLNF
jgi:glycosyltransferase involved in cell wall biosynthesis